MARNFGHQFDWWERPTLGGATMKGVAEDFFRWNMLKEDFPWYEFESGEPQRATTGFNILETTYTRLELDNRITKWLKVNRPVERRQGDPYCTLLKGDL